MTASMHPLQASGIPYIWSCQIVTSVVGSRSFNQHLALPLIVNAGWHIRNKGLAPVGSDIPKVVKLTALSMPTQSKGGNIVLQKNQGYREVLLSDRNWTGLTIQTASLHWQNNSKQMDGWSCNKATTTTVKQAVEKHQEAYRRELVDESSTVLCATKSIHGVPGSETLSQLLVTWK